MTGRLTLRNKKIILGITGCIAAYKSADILRSLVKKGADVWVVMTDSAQEFITPLTFRTLSGNPCITNMFDKSSESMPLPHISLSDGADLLLVAPATANILGKAANGLADDILSTLLLSCSCKKIFAPAMNTKMWESKAVQENLKKARSLGIEMIEPDLGELACGQIGKGRMAQIEMIVEHVEKAVGTVQDLAGKRILVTAGGTKELIDPVRFIGNMSSGRMGYEVARAASERGAIVTLISASELSEDLPGVTIHTVQSAGQMSEAVKEHLPRNDALVMAAAVSDFSPSKRSSRKIKKDKGPLNISLEPTEDILGSVSRNKKGKVVVGFALESEDLIANAKKKLKEKQLDMIVANDISAFGAKDSRVSIIEKNGAVKKFPMQSKYDTANRILDRMF